MAKFFYFSLYKQAKKLYYGGFGMIWKFWNGIQNFSSISLLGNIRKNWCNTWGTYYSWNTLWSCNK